jgi:hypothetical protein
MKKILITLVAIIVIGGGIFFLSESNPETGQVISTTPQRVEASIEVDREVHDFGRIDIFGGKVESGFILTNSGDEEVEVYSATTSCGCTAGDIDGVSFGMHEKMSRAVRIPAGGSKSVTAIYDPLAHGPDATGEITRQLFLDTSSSTTPEIELRVSADVYKTE